MTKAQIVNEISKSTGIEKANVLETVEKFMEVVKDSLANGENVYLRGFGSFIVKYAHKKPLATSLKTKLSLSLNTKSQSSNLLKCSWKKLSNIREQSTLFFNL